MNVNVWAERLAETLPQEALIVVYYGGPQCPHSLLVGRWLLEHGWLKVLHFVQGYPAWQSAGYPVETGSAEPRAVP
jgi:3-mercaptopyruvate sulfurtransferase SseA